MNERVNESISRSIFNATTQHHTSTNFVGNTLTQSEAIETYTPYNVTSSRPRKTKIAFFANFGGIEKLFCVPEQSLNLKIMNQCNIDFNFLE